VTLFAEYIPDEIYGTGAFILLSSGWFLLLLQQNFAQFFFGPFLQAFTDLPADSLRVDAVRWLGDSACDSQRDAGPSFFTGEEFGN
jgi:hypothetical protein